VDGTISLSGGNGTGRLRAGLIRAKGHFTAPGYITGTEVRSTGTVLRMEGGTAQNIQLVCSNATSNGCTPGDRQPGRRHDRQQPARQQHIDVIRALTAPAGVTITGVQHMFLRGTSVLNNDGTIDVAACTKENGPTINGTDPCP
jgi:hypothetical protein